MVLHRSAIKAPVDRPPVLPRWAFEVIFALCALASAFTALSIVGRHQGWPVNDEFVNSLGGLLLPRVFSPAVVTQMYAVHLRHFDFFPVWSSSDGFGLGTPLLLYYSKFFFYVSGPIFIVLGNIKASLVLTIAFFMLVGTYGMRMALSTITRRRILLTVGSVGLLFTNWTFSDWLGRGDMAEFSAMMLIPWLLWWCLNLVTNHTASFALIPIAVLLFIAHTLIAGLAVIVLVWALLVMAFTAQLPDLKRMSLRVILSVLGVIAVLSPLLVTVVRFSSDYDPMRKFTEAGFLASNHFLSWGQLLDNSGFRWLTGGVKSNGQIDFAIWISTTAGLVVTAITMVAPRRWERARRYFNVPVMAFLLGSEATFLLLQSRTSRSIYNLFGWLNTIQFPARMLVLIIPIGIIIVVAFIEALFTSVQVRLPRAGRLLWCVPIGWLAWLMALSPVPVSFDPSLGFIPSSQLVVRDIGPSGSFLMWGFIGEYLPQVDRQGTVKTVEMYGYLLAHEMRSQALSSARCTVSEPATAFESLHIEIHLRCNRPTRLALPISVNGYTTIRAETSGGRSQPLRIMKVRDDPRLVIWVNTDRPMDLSVSLPTLWGVVF
jgi:hypothetical protein